MVNLKELRIDNKLYRNGNVVTVSAILKTHIRTKEKYSTEHNRYFEPIPLTEEILLKCGFEKSSFHTTTSLYHNDHTPYQIVFKKNGNIFFRITGYTLCKIETLHHLQNLFFSLVGKELEVNL